MTLWLVNPGKRKRGRKRASSSRRRSKRKPPKGFRTWGAYMASIRPNKGGKMARKRRRSGGKRRHRRNPSRVVHVVRRTRGRRRSFRRNPGGSGFSPRGIVRNMIEAGKGAVAVQVGKSLTRTAAAFVPVTGFAGLAVQLVAATVLGMLSGRFLGVSFGQDVAKGGISGVVEQVAAGMGIPVLNGAPLMLGAGAGASTVKGYPGASVRLNGYAGAPVNLGAVASADEASGYLF